MNVHDMYTKIKPLTDAVEAFTLTNHALLNDSQLCSCSTILYELDKIINESLMEEHRKSNPDSLTHYSGHHTSVNDILKARMHEYQLRTGNTDNGIFPFITFKIDNIPDNKIEDLQYFKKNLLNAMKIPISRMGVGHE